MLIKHAEDLASSDITPQGVYMRRRDFLGTLAAITGLGDKLTTAKMLVTTTDAPTPREAVVSYCNFYEFGSAKTDAARYAGVFKATPWSVVVEGLCAKPGTYTLEDVVKPHPLEERVYRMRCVEGWSMVIPWIGFPLGDFLRRFQPTSRAKYVELSLIHI